MSNSGSLVHTEGVNLLISNSWSKFALLILECKEEILRNEKAGCSRVKEFGAGGGGGGGGKRKNPSKIFVIDCANIFPVRYRIIILYEFFNLKKLDRGH